eukprot:145400-Pelagomonas_calceolata.AAC.8
MLKNLCAEKESDGVVCLKFRTGKYKPKELKQLLDKPGQLEEVKKRYDIIIIITKKEELQPCMLKCKGCSTLVSTVNPPQTTKQHSSSCNSPPEDDEMEELDGADDEEGEIV